MGRKQDYHNSIIYHIRHMESKEVVYVGSTTKFSQRKATHKWLCNHEEGKDFTIPIYYHIRNNGGFDCFEVIPIKSLKLENKTQLLIAEQEEIDKHGTLVNGYKAHTTIEEHKEYMKQHNKQWRKENKENINEKKKLYYQEKKEQFKQYYQDHKQEIAEKKKQYYQKNIENNPEKYKEKAECEYCAKLLSKQYMSRHHKTCKSKPKEEN